MFQLMIADDNPYILQELCQDTDWEDFDFELTGAYRDGKTLLNAAREAMPDLVITDISMPIMDGMELSASLHRLNPDLKIIFISEHSEFEYAKRALNLQILDYLVKPIRQEQLGEVMNHVLGLLQQEQCQRFEQMKLWSQQDFYRRSALSHYASRLLFHADPEQQIREEFVRLGFPPGGFRRFYVVCYHLNSPTPCSYLESILETSASGARILSMDSRASHGVFLLLASHETISVSNLLSQLCIDVEAGLGLSITIGYSNPSTCFSELPSLYTQAKAALSSIAGTTVPLASYRDTHAESDPSADLTSGPAVSGTYSKNVAAMRAFVKKNYMEQITTSDVAQSVYLSPSYANLCFHNECGITIFAYITQYRIQRAKELLRDTEEHVTRIAELVGYSGKTSFYLAFKRSTGISPSEYRRKNVVFS